MSTLRRRRYVLAGVFAVVSLVAAALLFEVIATVFFAITVAYVLYPVRARLVDRGVPVRVASALATLVAFLAVVLLIVPMAVALYQRRHALFALLQALPPTLSIELAGFTYAVDVAAALEGLRGLLGSLAVDIARAAPVLGLKLFLFAFVVFALLYRPMDVRRAVFGLVPPAYHDDVLGLHRRVRSTLFAIYVLQAVTAIATFVLAFVVFAGLGYESPFVLAVVAGILQFIPVVGPSLLVAGLAAFDLAFGDPTRALLVALLGLVVVGFLPDAVIRPRLARRTTHLPASIYFIGFTGGVLSVGVVGFIAGPLVVAILLEVAALLSES